MMPVMSARGELQIVDDSSQVVGKWEQGDENRRLGCATHQHYVQRKTS